MDNCVAVYRRGIHPLGIGCQKGRICVYGHTVVVIGCVLRGKSDGGAFFKASVRSLAFKFHGVILHYGECEIVLRGNWINDDIADLFPVFLIAIVVAGCFVGHMECHCPFVCAGEHAPVDEFCLGSSYPYVA